MRLLIALLAAMGPLTAGAETAHRSPYAGMEPRPLKSLSDREIADLRAGRGMGLALAAELNGYPGPAHVLELADALDLTSDQLAHARALHEAMLAEARPLGEELVRHEARLEALFASGTIDSATLAEQVEAIGRIRAALRLAHLVRHLSMRDHLTAEQITAYRRLRGYTSAGAGDHERQHHRP